MKKLFQYLHDLFKPKKNWVDQMCADFDKRLLQMHAEHAAEAEFDAAWLASMEEEHTLTDGRQVTLHKPSRTLH